MSSVVTKPFKIIDIIFYRFKRLAKFVSLKPVFSFCIIVGAGCLLSLPGYMKDAMYVEIGTQRADKRIKELKKIEEKEKKNS